jgi:hypothetical protein
MCETASEYSAADMRSALGVPAECAVVTDLCATVTTAIVAAADVTAIARRPRGEIGNEDERCFMFHTLLKGAHGPLTQRCQGITAAVSQ